MEKKVQNIYLTDYNLLTALDLWQAHYLAERIHKIKCEYEKKNTRNIKNIKKKKEKYMKKPWKMWNLQN